MPLVTTPSYAPCTSEKELSTTPTLVYGVPAIERQRAVIARYGQIPTLTWQMIDRGGRPADLTACLAECVSLGVDSPCGSVVLRIREFISSVAPIGVYTGIVTDAATGMVSVSIDTQLGTQGPGIYIGEIAMLDAGGVETLGNLFTLYLEPSLFAPVPGSSGPPTIMEVRLGLRDSSSTESRLLDTVTFDDAEIAMAAVRCIQYFNETQPPVEARYNTQNFPFRYHWVRGMAGQLFYMLAEYYRKNQLQYQAGGIAVDDFNKSPLYDQAGDRLWSEYTRFATSQKCVIAQNECWGEASTPYAESYAFSRWNSY